MSSHLAVISSEGLVGQRKLLETARSGFISNGQDCLPVRPIVHESWLRCLRSGIDPARKQAENPPRGDNIQEIIACSKLYEHAKAILPELLNQTQDTKFLLTLCNAQGKIIYLGGDPQARKQAEKMNFVLGSDWSEEAIGTNAIGTSLKTAAPAQIFSAEHFCEGVHDWICSASPIQDPLTKELIGVIDFTGLWLEAQAHTLGMTLMASKVIENKILYDLNQYTRATIAELLARYSSAVQRYPQSGVMVLDAACNLIEANPSARVFVQQATGKDLETLGKERAFANFKNSTYSVHPANLPEYDLFVEELARPVSIQEVHLADKCIGYLLIIGFAQRNTGTKGSLRNANASANGNADAIANTYDIVDANDNAHWDKIVGNSSLLHIAINKCNRVANADVPILLLGESGTGKELFAQGIHHSSDRQKGPFITINCGAVPKDLLASELFGYEPGTFTGALKGGRKGKFEEAHGGTIFLDEIGEMPLEFQVHLLRVLQEREVVRLGSSKPHPVDVKIIAATHHNLEQLVQDRLFRPDFYYRLQVVSINIPPLRERRDDIPLLIEHFLAQFSQKHHKPLLTLDAQVSDYFINHYEWPGNVRELQNVLEHGVLFCLSETIGADVLPRNIKNTIINNCLGNFFNPGSMNNDGRRSSHRLGSKNDKPITKRDFSCSNVLQSTEAIAGTTGAACTAGTKSTDSCEKEALLRLIRGSNGNLSASARKLGIARSTLYRRLKKYGITQSQIYR